jgi:hypothetical protein
VANSPVCTENSEARFKRKNISPTIVADVKRFCHQIKRTRFSVHTGRVEDRVLAVIRNAAAQTRTVSGYEIRLNRWKSARLFKRIVCADISEFESYMPSQPVRSLCAHDAAVAQTAGPEGDRAFACRRLNRNDRFILGAGLLLYSTRNRDEPTNQGGLDFCPRNAGRSRRKEVANSIHVEHGGHQRRAVARTGSQ